MIGKTNKTMSVSKQCDLLQVNRSSLYYTPSCESEENLRILRWLDEQYCEPFLWSKKTVTATTFAWLACQSQTLTPIDEDNELENPVSPKKHHQN